MDIKSFNLKQQVYITYYVYIHDLFLLKYTFKLQKETEDFKIQEKRDRIQFFEDEVLGEMESADMKYFSYASQLLAECEIANRPKEPVLKTIRVL